MANQYAAPTMKRPLYQSINGFLFPCSFYPKCVHEAFNYKARPDDVFIATFPKCGTTWMQSIALYIFRQGKPLEDVRQIYTASPFLEMLGLDGVSRMPRPGTIKTHLPYSHMPYHPEAKYIFVARNPRDACVSLYHHTRMITVLNYADATFDEFFEIFINGETEYNDYFDHLLSWYPHRNDSNVFYTTYENMKKDIKYVIRKLAGFLGPEYGSLVENDNAVLENIVKYSEFEYMKENISPMYTNEAFRYHVENDLNPLEGLMHRIQFHESLVLPQNLPKTEFLRKGAVGDWENYFNEKQLERLNKKCKEKFKGTDIEKLWPLLY